MSSPTPISTPRPSCTFKLSDLPKLDLQVDRFHPMATTVEILLKPFWTGTTGGIKAGRDIKFMFFKISSSKPRSNNRATE